MVKCVYNGGLIFKLYAKLSLAPGLMNPFPTKSQERSHHMDSCSDTFILKTINLGKTNFSPRSCHHTLQEFLH